MTDTHTSNLKSRLLKALAFDGADIDNGDNAFRAAQRQHTRTRKLVEALVELTLWAELACENGFACLARRKEGEPMFYDTCDVSAQDFAGIWYINLHKALAKVEACLEEMEVNP
jgi:hypothetical protein